MAIPDYNVRKAAQVTAFFAKKQGGAIDVLKVAKLLYCSIVSMPHGPVTSMTLNYINGLEEDHYFLF
jgi:hypothetical protein